MPDAEAPEAETAIAPGDVADPSDEYVAGVCNIGTTEAANRRRFGYTGLVVTVGLWVLDLVFGWNAFVLILLIFPGFLMASGFMQARSRFCSGFGMHGMSNFNDELGFSGQTKDPAELAADRARSRQITMRSLGVGVLVAAVGVASALVL